MEVTERRHPNPSAAEPRPASMSDLRKLYSGDPEQLFALVNDAARPQDMEVIARRVALLMRDGFQVTTRAGSHVAEGTRGGIVVLDDPAADRRFLEELYVGASAQKSLAGESVSDANIDFYLQQFEWEDRVRSMRLLRLHPNDIGILHSEGAPPYQVYELLDCAREVVRSPHAVWHGLREAGTLKQGWAYCGTPSRSWRNDGSHASPRDGFVYVVYADDEGNVFDWDWVRSDSGDPRLPEAHNRRFGTRVSEGTEAELIVNVDRQRVHFEPCPVYSHLGDCVFYYFKEDEAFARRIDEYLTAYFSFEREEPVGYKVKYVSKLMDTVKQWSRTRDEGIYVSFDPETVRVRLEFLMQAWLGQKLPLTQDLQPGMAMIDLLQQLRTIWKAEVELPKDLVESA